MSEHPEPAHQSNGHRAPTSLNAAVRRRRADRDFFLRVRDAIQQNHRALERLGR
ncbi:MAG: hypothetical protein ACLPVF_09165 [Acidimicrobiales bacterium]